MGDLFDGYQVGRAWDEVLGADGLPRPEARALHEGLSTLSAAELQNRATSLASAFRDQGITLSLRGEERPFPLDLVPRIVTAPEWDAVERGVVQRVRALEAFLADLADRQQVLQDGILPRRLVLSSTSYYRAAHGIVRRRRWASRSPARVIPGSRPGWATGGPTTRRTGSRSATGTCPSPRAGTMATWRRSRGSTPAAAHLRSGCRSPSCNSGRHFRSHAHRYRMRRHAGCGAA